MSSKEGILKVEKLKRNGWKSCGGIGDYNNELVWKNFKREHNLPDNYASYRSSDNIWNKMFYLTYFAPNIKWVYNDNYFLLSSDYCYHYINNKSSNMTIYEKNKNNIILKSINDIIYKITRTDCFTSNINNIHWSKLTNGYWSM